MKKNKVIYLFDGSYYVCTSYYEVKSIKLNNGIPINAVYGFFYNLIEFIKKYNPSHLVIVFDSRIPNFRHRLYLNYKGNRPPLPSNVAIQFNIIYKILNALKIYYISILGIEGDDIIGTIAKKFYNMGYDVIIIANDKDFYQLVNDHIYIYNKINDQKYRIINIKKVREIIGVNPSQVVDFLSLIGDKTDNIQGIQGIDRKMAYDLIQQYNNLENIYNNIFSLNEKKLKIILINNKQKILLSKYLIGIECDIGLKIMEKDLIINKKKNINKLLKIKILLNKLNLKEISNIFDNLLIF